MTTRPATTGVRLRRVGVLIEHNALATRFSSRYWVLVLAGLFEPLFYLFSLGIGVGSLIEREVLHHGLPVEYASYVAPGVLAVSAMSAALGVSVFGFFGKLRHSRIFEAIFATPVRTFEIALGELAWAVLRTALFGTLFLGVLAAMGIVTPLRALVSLPGVILVGAAFAATGMAAGTYLRGWQDFELIGMAQTAMLLFSGTFFPVSNLPGVLQWFVTATPLYQAIELLRGVTLGGSGASVALHFGYLVAMVVLGLAVTRHRVERTLRR